LPLREAVAARTGPVRSARTVSGGFNSALAVVLDTPGGRVFVKGIRGDHRGVVTQSREALVNAAVRPVAPALLWHLPDVAGWNVLGFEWVEGRHADYRPGSADVAAVVAALDVLAGVPCPDVPGVKDASRWRCYADGGDTTPFEGDALLHTDWKPDNVLIQADATVRVADHVRKAGQRPASKPGDAQLVSVARRADRGMPTEETVRIFQSVNETNHKRLERVRQGNVHGAHDGSLATLAKLPRSIRLNTRHWHGPRLTAARLDEQCTRDPPRRLVSAREVDAAPDHPHQLHAGRCFGCGGVISEAPPWSKPQGPRRAPSVRLTLVPVGGTIRCGRCATTRLCRCRPGHGRSCG